MQPEKIIWPHCVLLTIWFAIKHPSMLGKIKSGIDRITKGHSPRSRSVLFTLKKPTESMLKPNGFKREFLNRFQDEKIMAVLFFTILVLRISLRCLSFIRSMTHLLHCMAIWVV